MSIMRKGILNYANKININSTEAWLAPKEVFKENESRRKVRKIN